MDLPREPMPKARVKSFASRYNCQHLHSALRFVTPNARHDGQDHATLASRTVLYANARAQNPQLAARRTRLAEPGKPNQRP